MQISSYSSISNINIFSPSKHNDKSKINSQNQFDTVSISEEAKVAYKDSISKNTNLNNSQLEARLTTFFNTYHDGPDFHVNKNIKFESCSGELLPENKKMIEDLESEINKLFAGINLPQNSIVPQDIQDKWLPLRDKIDAIHALGDVMVLDDATLDYAANFLRKLEDTWTLSMGDDSSLEGQFHDSINNWKKQPQTEEEIREKIEKKKSELANI